MEQLRLELAEEFNVVLNTEDGFGNSSLEKWIRNRLAKSNRLEPEFLGIMRNILTESSWYPKYKLIEKLYLFYKEEPAWVKDEILVSVQSEEPIIRNAGKYSLIQLKTDAEPFIHEITTYEYAGRFDEELAQIAINVNPKLRDTVFHTLFQFLLKLNDLKDEEDIYSNLFFLAENSALSDAETYLTKLSGKLPDEFQECIDYLKSILEITPLSAMDKFSNLFPEEMSSDQIQTLIRYSEKKEIPISFQALGSKDKEIIRKNSPKRTYTELEENFESFKFDVKRWRKACLTRNLLRLDLKERVKSRQHDPYYARKALQASKKYEEEKNNSEKLIQTLESITDTRPSFDEAIEAITELSDKARRFGLLALEDYVSFIKEPLCSISLQLIVDGTDPEKLRKVLDGMAKSRVIEVQKYVNALVEGMIELQDGTNPRVVREIMAAFR